MYLEGRYTLVIIYIVSFKVMLPGIKLLSG